MSDARARKVKATAKVVLTLEVECSGVWSHHTLDDVFAAAKREATEKAKLSLTTGDGVFLLAADVSAVLTPDEGSQP